MRSAQAAEKGMVQAKDGAQQVRKEGTKCKQ
jgi:hypothetical protein